MKAAVASVNIVLGLAYIGIGAVTAIEMGRDRRTYGFSHFGMAFLFVAWTCGPHHLDHGIHAALGDARGGPLDAITAIAGLPVGVVWLALRLEAFLGGRGDRFIGGTPWWVAVAPPVAGVYLTALVAAALRVEGGFAPDRLSIANAVLVVVYLAIAWALLRAQLRNRTPMGGWSLSGLSLSGIFATCALMHGALALYRVRGIYDADIHGLAIAGLAVPAGLYFLGVVRGLYRESLDDWNTVGGELAPEQPSLAAGRTS